MDKKKLSERNVRFILVGLLFLEVAVLILFVFSAIVPYARVVLAAVGQDNVTVQTFLQVGNVVPEILNVSIDNAAADFDLTPNATTLVVVNITARDFNGEGDIANLTAEFFDTSASSFGAADDNNNHYTNDSCTIDTSAGDIYEVVAECSFAVEYYANNATWNATVVVTDNATLTGQGSDVITINSLLALNLPDSIDYGEVNATEVSGEQIANVTNAGNSVVNLTLSGYAVSEGDGNAMNCSLGAIQNISIEYEKYNLTSSLSGPLTLSEFEGNYTNLTSSVVVNQFDLMQRQNDTDMFVDETNATYWRVYVPVGVAGSCSGNIIFGAVQSAAS